MFAHESMPLPLVAFTTNTEISIVCKANCSFKIDSLTLVLTMAETCPMFLFNGKQKQVK